jgi:hypothetical protein
MLGQSLHTKMTIPLLDRQAQSMRLPANKNEEGSLPKMRRLPGTNP